MNEDPITNNFTAGVNIKLIKKLVLLIRIIFCMSFVYSLAELYMWYLLVSKSLDYDMSQFPNFYNYRIQPVLTLFLFVMNIIGYLLNIKSFMLMAKGIEETDPIIFNRGFVFTYRVMFIAILCISVSLFNAITILILK